MIRQFGEHFEKNKHYTDSPNVYVLKPWNKQTPLAEPSVLDHQVRISLFSLLSIVPDDDISVGFRPLRALLVGERIVQLEL